MIIRTISAESLELEECNIGDGVNKTLKSPSSSQAAASVPLPQLVQQLLKNLSQQSLGALQRLMGDEAPLAANDSGLDLLLQFQRLLLVRLYSQKSGHLDAAQALLSRYMAWLCGHAAENLQMCIPLIQQQRTNVTVVGGIVTLIRNNVIGTPLS